MSAQPARKTASFSITRAIPLIALKMGLTTGLDKKEHHMITGPLYLKSNTLGNGIKMVQEYGR